MRGSTRNIVVIIIDLFQRKNQLQHDVMVANGYAPLWLQCNTSMTTQQDQERILLQPQFLQRTIFIFKLLWKHRKQIHHVEIYPGGRYMAVVLMLAKLFSLKILCVERGDLFFIHQNKYSKLTTWSAKQIYTFANWIWTRELYADSMLKKMNIKTPQFFIHNVTTIPSDKGLPVEEKDIDFLWVNTLKDFRRFDWFIQSMHDPIFQSKKSVVLGLTDTTKLSEIYKDNYDQLNNIPSNISLVPFTNPKEYYRRAKYFVLPTSLVYLNNSLLEAMSYGVVPLLCDSEGVTEIVDHGKDGFISAYSAEAYHALLNHTLQINTEEFQKLSAAAIQKVREQYSPTYYENQLMTLYQKLNS